MFLELIQYCPATVLRRKGLSAVKRLKQEAFTVLLINYATVLQVLTVSIVRLRSRPDDGRFSFAKYSYFPRQRLYELGTTAWLLVTL
jgi:hypothetical protein